MKCNLICLLALVAGNFAIAVPPPRPVEPKPVPLPLPADRIFRAGPIRPVPPPIRVGRPAPIPPRGMPRTTTKGENVKLLNGEIFHGKFIGFDPAKGVIWQHPHIKPDNFEIKPGSVASVTFADQKLPATAKQHSCNVVLVNDDSLSGELVSLENDKLILKTWYAGNLPIRRSAIKSLSPGFTAAKTIFEGPTDIRNWSFTNPNQRIAFPQLPPNAPPAQVEAMKRRMEAMRGKWELKDSGFEARTTGAMVGRNFKNLPDRASIEFDVEWSSYLNLYVNLYADQLNSYSACNAYQLRINQTYAYLYRYTRTRSQNVGGNVRINLSTVVGKRRINIAFKVDKKKREFALYVNGQFKQTWKDMQPDFAGKGSGLLFTTRSANLIRVSDIRIQEWNGSLPGQSKVAATNGKEDFVVFNNEDSITGKLIGIKGGQMEFKTTFAELPIPLENVDTIHLSKEGIKTPPIPADSMRVTLKGKGTLTLRIKKWKDGKITATSPIFGETTLDANALRSVEFNFGKPRTTAAVAPSPRSPYATNPLRNNGAIPGIQILGGRAFGGGLPPEVMEKLEIQERLQEQRLKIKPRRR